MEIAASQGAWRGVDGGDIMNHCGAVSPLRNSPLAPSPCDYPLTINIRVQTDTVRKKRGRNCFANCRSRRR